MIALYKQEQSLNFIVVHVFGVFGPNTYGLPYCLQKWDYFDYVGMDEKQAIIQGIKLYGT